MTTNAPRVNTGTTTGHDPTTRGRFRTARDAAAAVAGGVLGVLPHVMHHIGLLAGAALVTGAADNAAFYALGLLFSLPLLRRLYRRFRTWWAPALAVGAFTVLFAFSALVVGPALTTARSPANPPQAPAGTPMQDHAAHHGGQ